MSEGRHCKVLQALVAIDYFEQDIMLTRVNEATIALSMDPSSMYISLSKFVRFSIRLIMVGMVYILLRVAVLHTYTHMSSQICYVIC